MFSLRHFVIMIFLFVVTTVHLPAQDNNIPPGGKKYPVRFHFLVIPKKNAAMIDWVKVIDANDNVLGQIDFGKGDTEGDSHVLLDDNGGHWGDIEEIDNISVRYVNGRDSVWEHSAFIVSLVKPLEEGMIIRVRYRDSGTDLMPIEYVRDGRSIRIGQIFLENSEKWLEDEFDIPYVK